MVVLVTSSSSKPALARLSLHFGSRGRAVQKPLLMPLRTAQAVVRQIQARLNGLVAVVSGLGHPPGLRRGSGGSSVGGSVAEGTYRLATALRPTVCSGSHRWFADP